jgi:hypothetical protein
MIYVYLNMPMCMILLLIASCRMTMQKQVTYSAPWSPSHFLVASSSVAYPGCGCVRVATLLVDRCHTPRHAPCTTRQGTLHAGQTARVHLPTPRRHALEIQPVASCRSHNQSMKPPVVGEVCDDASLSELPSAGFSMKAVGCLAFHRCSSVAL